MSPSSPFLPLSLPPSFLPHFLSRLFPFPIFFLPALPPPLPLSLPQILITRVTGPEPGYVATPIIFVELGEGGPGRIGSRKREEEAQPFYFELTFALCFSLPPFLPPSPLPARPTPLSPSLPPRRGLHTRSHLLQPA